jgi:hypothetical protein
MRACSRVGRAPRSPQLRGRHGRVDVKRRRRWWQRRPWVSGASSSCRRLTAAAHPAVPTRVERGSTDAGGNNEKKRVRSPGGGGAPSPRPSRRPEAPRGRAMQRACHARERIPLTTATERVFGSIRTRKRLCALCMLAGGSWHAKSCVRAPSEVERGVRGDALDALRGLLDDTCCSQVTVYAHVDCDKLHIASRLGPTDGSQSGHVRSQNRSWGEGIVGVSGCFS